MALYPVQAAPEVHREWVTTAFTVEGSRIVRNLGLVRGIIVRSRSVIGNVGAVSQRIFGGNITLYTEMCDHARDDPLRIMLQHPAHLGANGVVGVRYDAAEVAP